VLVLGASNIRLVIENWMKYGLLIGLPHNSIPTRDFGLFFTAWLCIPLSLTISLVLEYGMGRLALLGKNAKPDFLKKLGILEIVVSTAHCIQLVFLLTFPSYIAYTQIYHPLGKIFITIYERESNSLAYHCYLYCFISWIRCSCIMFDFVFEIHIIRIGKS
jgi:hypothetical protein